LAFKRVVDALTQQSARWDIVRLSGAHRRTLPVHEVRLEDVITSRRRC